MVLNILQIFGRMLGHILRRGKGIFKALFVIDSFFRVFTMTIIIPLFFSLMRFNIIIVYLGLLLGIIIDVHDFIADAGFAEFL